MYSGNVGWSAIGRDGRLNASEAQRAARKVPPTVIAQLAIFGKSVTPSACWARARSQVAQITMQITRARTICVLPAKRGIKQFQNEPIGAPSLVPHVTLLLG